MKLKKTILKSERLILKPFSPKNAEQYSKLGRSINDIKKAKKWIKSSWKKDSYYFGIFLRESNELIGELELCHMNWWFDKAGEICYFIKKEHRGKGYATESAEAMINLCFKKLKFRKMYADTDPDNSASQNVLKKLGFKLEGKIREKNFVHGKWTDELDYGLLKSDWNKK